MDAMTQMTLQVVKLVTQDTIYKMHIHVKVLVRRDFGVTIQLGNVNNVIHHVLIVMDLMLLIVLSVTRINI